MLRLHPLLLTSLVLLSPLRAFGAPLLGYAVLQTSAHNPSTFTQGLIYEDGLIYESSGLYGASYIEVYRADSGKQLNKELLPRQIFAEGLSKVGKELFLLTWRQGILFRLDAETLKVKRTMRYSGEGWGLSVMGEQLVMSNGSNTLSLRDANTFSEVGSIKVFEGNAPIDKLNELEYDGKHIWANRWQSHIVYQIHPSSGKVLAKLDLAELFPREQKQPLPDVLNGIAYVPEKNAFWISGKKWSKRYLIQIESNTSQ